MRHRAAAAKAEVQAEVQAFCSKLFDAMADDRVLRLDRMEAWLNDYAHVARRARIRIHARPGDR